MARLFDAVCLDVGGVLLLPPPECAWAVLGREEPLDLERHRRAHYAGMAGYDAGGGDWREYLREFCGVYGVGADGVDAAARRLRAAMDTHPWSVPIQESVTALADIRATGAGVAIVSNSDGTVAGQLASLGICQVGEGAGVAVDVIIDSHVAGVAKPAPGIFDLALEATGTTPARTAHVGDCIWADVGGARAAGLHPVHFDPLRACPDDDHAHVAGLRELVGLLTD
jgi:putative hydrolase of the HAD superfamily